MADNEKGGLSSVDPMADFSQKIRQQTLESQQVLDAHRKRLMELMSSRQQMPFDPAMMSLAAGLLSPTKTGGFGESLAAGMTNYAAEAEKQFRRQQEEAKLGYELEMAAQEQKRKMMGQQFFGELASRKKTTLSPPSATEAPAVVPSAAPSDASSAPPVVRADDSIRSEVAQAPVKEAPPAPSSPNQVLAQVNKNDQQIRNLLGKIQTSGSDAFADISNEEIAMLEMYSPEYAKMINSYRDAVNKGTTLDVSRLNAFVSASKLELDKVQEMRNQAELDLKRKKSGFEEREVKTKEASVPITLPSYGDVKVSMENAERWSAAQNSGDIQKMMTVMEKMGYAPKYIVGTDGKIRFMSPNELEIKKEREKARFTQTPVKRAIPELGAGTFEINPIDYEDYKDAGEQGPDALQLWFNKNFRGQNIKIPGAKIGNFGAESKVQSVEERGIEEARQKKLAEKEAENTIALDNTIRNAGRQADGIIQNSDNLLDLMTKKEYSGAWGMFSGPGVKNAAVKFISSGIDVGNFRVGVPAFEAALRQAKMTDDEVEGSIRAMQIYGEQKLQIARRDLAGEGSVSDGERRLIGDVSGSIDMPLKSAMAVAELFKYRGEFDKKTATMYNQWRDKNPAMAGNRFFDTDEYRSLVKSYDGVMNDLRQKYYPSKAKPAAKSESSRSNTVPPKKSKDNPYLQGQ